MKRRKKILYHFLALLSVFTINGNPNDEKENAL